MACSFFVIAAFAGVSVCAGRVGVWHCSCSICAQVRTLDLLHFNSHQPVQSWNENDDGDPRSVPIACRPSHFVCIEQQCFGLRNAIFAANASLQLYTTTINTIKCIFLHPITMQPTAARFEVGAALFGCINSQIFSMVTFDFVWILLLPLTQYAIKICEFLVKVNCLSSYYNRFL